MRYKAYTITETPTEKIPTMVTVSRAKLKKKFVDERSAKIWIDTLKTEKLIKNQKIKVQDELLDKGLYFYED